VRRRCSRAPGFIGVADQAEQMPSSTAVVNDLDTELESVVRCEVRARIDGEFRTGARETGIGAPGA